MKEQTISLLLILNIVFTTALGVFMLTRSGGDDASPAAVAPQPAPTITVDLSSINTPLTKVSKDLDQLTSTIQRFNTSLVQYDFLKQEMERLAMIDQTINVRARATAAAKTDENEAEVTDTLTKLVGLSQQVKSEQQTRRQTMLKLISGLEQQLAQISNSPMPKPIQPQPRRVQPRPTPTPAPTKPATAPAGKPAVIPSAVPVEDDVKPATPAKP